MKKIEKEDIKEAVIEEDNKEIKDIDSVENSSKVSTVENNSNDEDEMIEAVDKELKEVKNSSEYKPTTMIKLDDISEDERFFDDFFDD